LLKVGPEGSGYGKAAKFLLLLGQEEAANVLRHLKPEEVEKLSKEIVKVDRIPSEEARSILEEFGVLAQGRGLGSNGGIAAAQSMLATAFGEEKGASILRKAVPESVKRPFEFLNQLDPSQVILAMKEEPVAVAAVILSYLSPKQASAVIRQMTPDQQHETIKRIATLESIAPDVIAKMEEGIREKISRQGRVETESVDGAAALANILRYLGPEDERSILEDLDEANPEIGRSIRERLFTLEDILQVSDRQLQAVLRDWATKDLALLLKGKDDGFRKKILANVSTNRRTVVLEEYDYIGPARREDVDGMTRRFLNEFKSMHEAGKLIVATDDDIVN